MEPFPPYERATKAAILLLAMRGSFGPGLVQQLAAHDIRTLAEEAKAITQVDEQLLDELVAEFAREMDRPQAIEGGSENINALLSEALPEANLQQMLAPSGDTPDIWDKFTAGSENTLAPYLLDEHPQTVAYILSRLERDLSAKLLAMLPRGQRDAITRRLLKLQEVKAPVSRLLQDCLSEDLLHKDAGDSDAASRAVTADILNRLEREQSQEILDALQEERPEEAGALRKLLFNFEDVVRLSHEQRLLLFDKVQTDQVMLALRASAPELRETVLSSLSARSRRMVEAELATAPNELGKDVITARQVITGVALKLVMEGLISLPEASETTVEIALDAAE